MQSASAVQIKYVFTLPKVCSTGDCLKCVRVQGADAEGGKTAHDNNAELCSPRRHCSPNQVCVHNAEGLQHCQVSEVGCACAEY